MEKKAKKLEMKLPSYDDLFTTQEQRDVESITSGKILDIPIEEIDEFENHPFYVKDDEDMERLVESIRDNGIIEPATVRKKDDGRYEMISGHRRMHACKRLGITNIRAEIKDITKDEAIIMMVDANIQREEILPSERAFAFKMRMDALRRSAGRPSKNNGDPVGPHLKSSAILANDVNESPTQIKRYIRLTELIPEILNMVDMGKIKMRPAVELSYLEKNEQQSLSELMEAYACTPSHAQAIRMRKMSAEGNLDYSALENIIAEQKPNQKEKGENKLNLPKAISDLLPAGISEDKAIKLICDAIAAYKPKKAELDNKPLKGQKKITDYKELE